MSVCVVKPVFPRKQLRQGEMNSKQLVVPVERRRDFKGYLEMVNGLLCVAFGVIYESKNTVALADVELSAFLREEIDRVGRGFFCGVELSVPMQRRTEDDQTRCLIRRLTKSFKIF